MTYSYRNVYVFTVVLLFFTLNAVEASYAQTTLANGRQVQGWVPLHITGSEQNIKDGVEACVLSATCNGEEVMLIRFFNHNNETVTINWNDVLLTKQFQVTSKNPISSKSLTINANDVVQGDCSDNNHPQLIVRKNDFIKDSNESKTNETLFFQVSFNKK
jgi:hypothetical protein